MTTAENASPYPPGHNRISWSDYFLGIADSVAVRADCTRRKVGAVVVDRKTKHIISTGYNGAPPGEPGCLSDGACPRGKHYKSMNYGTLDYGYHCGGCSTLLKKVPWPCEFAAVPGSSYDTGVNSCIAIHAEANALLRAGTQARGNWMFCTDEPCDGCTRLIKGAGIDLVMWYGGAWAADPAYFRKPGPLQPARFIQFIRKLRK